MPTGKVSKSAAGGAFTMLEALSLVTQEIEWACRIQHEDLNYVS